VRATWAMEALADGWAGVRKVASRYCFSGGLWSNSSPKGCRIGLYEMCGSEELLVFEHNRATTGYGGPLSCLFRGVSCLVCPCHGSSTRGCSTLVILTESISVILIGYCQNRGLGVVQIPNADESI
jgi:hypothetical protein